MNLDMCRQIIATETLAVLLSDLMRLIEPAQAAWS